MTDPPTLSPADWTRLILLSMLWGGSFFFVEVALRDLPVLTVVLARVGLAALALQIVLYASGTRLPATAAVWGTCLVMGILNNVLSFTLIVWAQTGITAALAAILNATTPMFAVLVAHLATRDEPITARRALGVVSGALGVAVMLGGGVLEGTVPAQLACLGAAASYACAGVWGRRFGRLSVAPLGAAAGQVTASTLLLLPIVLLADRPWTLIMPGPAPLLAVIALALLSTAFAYVLYFRILAGAGAVNLLLVTFLVPVSATALGIGILGESLGWRHLAGLALIAGGLAAIDGRVFRR